MHSGAGYIILGYCVASNEALCAGSEDGAAPETLPAASSCALCGGAPELPHLNCANIDCNKLFLACRACKVCLNLPNSMHSSHKRISIQMMLYWYQSIA